MQNLASAAVFRSVKQVSVWLSQIRPIPKVVGKLLSGHTDTQTHTHAHTHTVPVAVI